ncbi:MAG: hypothetical protein AB7T49_15540 [Oligoflexales bacterium]
MGKNLKLSEGIMVALCLTFTSCKMRDGGSKAMATSETPPKLECESGEMPIFFGMKAQENLPPIETLGIPPSVYTADRPNTYDKEISPNKTLRLDLCVDEVNGTARLVRIVSKDRMYGTYENKQSSEVKGLESLAFGGSFKDLDIAVEIGPGEFAPGSTSGGVIKGFEKVSYFYYGEKADGKWRPYINEIQAGIWEMGDPFANAVCTAGEAYGKSQFQLGTATIATEYCHHATSTGTTSYRVIHLDVKDSDPQLASADRETVMSGAEEISKVLTQKITHHNLCDSLHLKLPNREYWATSGEFQIGNAGQCNGSNIVEGAPVPPEGEAFKHIMYKVRYNDGDIREGETANCRSFIFGCQ